MNSVDTNGFISKKIYLDYNATTPIDKEVAQVTAEALISTWGNPSSSHYQGVAAKLALKESRYQIASAISSNPDDVIIVSGGTEGNNLIIYSVVEHYKKWLSSRPHGSPSLKRPHIISTKVEHDSVLYPLKNKYSNEADISFLSPNNLPEAIEEHIQPSTCLVSVMFANNETGIIFPITEISRVLKRVNRKRAADGLPKIFFHSDAAQVIGKIPVSVSETELDYLTIVGHKFYGPRIGAIYVKGLTKNETPLIPMFCGGGQERGFRPGTENMPMIVGLGKACSLVSQNVSDYQAHMKDVRDYLELKLKEFFGRYVKINCIEPCLPSSLECSKLPEEENKMKFVDVARLPNTSSVSFYYPEVTGVSLLAKCSVLMASTGSACHTGCESHSVLEESGVCSFHAERTLRLSVGRETTREDIESVVKDLVQAVKKLTLDSR